MCHKRQLFGAALLLCLVLAAAAACAETKVFVRVDYTGTVQGDAPEARVCLAAPLDKNEPYREYGTRYDLSWLTFASENTVYKYGRMGSSVVWMLPVSARNGDVVLYLDLSEVSGLRSVNEYTYNEDGDIATQSQKVFDKTDTCVLSILLKYSYDEDDYDDNGNWTRSTVELVYWEKDGGTQTSSLVQTRKISYWDD